MSASVDQVRTVVGFRITSGHAGWTACDLDRFNNWGRKIGFASEADAIRWAHWARDFKEGRTFSAPPL